MGEPLSRYTTFRIGGPARCIYFPTHPDAMAEAIGRARTEGVPWFVLGGGSNVLFPDSGFPGIVICTRRLRGIEERGDGRIFALAGTPLPELASRGLGFLRGIPGTVGGGVVMNAGTHDGAMADRLVSVRVLGWDGVPRDIPASECGLSYRDSLLKRLGATVIGAEFLPKKSPKDSPFAGDPYRRRTQPLGLPSAGCAFKNPPDAPPAGWLIDRAGLKGMRVGDAWVSTRHANFICNLGRATASQVLSLMERVRERVRRAFGVYLEPEIVIVWA